jgi:hypothetical protein
MSPDFDVFGVFVPSLLVWMAVAYLLHRLLRTTLDKAGVLRFVWHAPLFDFAAYLILLGALLLMFR